MEIQATFRHLEPTEELEKQIFDAAREMDHLTGGELTWCHVLMESRSRGHRGSLTQVKVAVLGSRGALGVTHDVRVRASHRRPKDAVTAAFDEVRRQIRAELTLRASRAEIRPGDRPRRVVGERPVLSWA